MKHPSRSYRYCSGATAIAIVALALVLSRCGDDDGATADGGVDAGPLCGNGEVDPGEECDDGNSDNTDGCCNTCLFCDNCTASHFAGCTPGETVCCPSAEDVATECVTRSDDPEVSRCLEACASGADCYWSNDCGDPFSGHCYPSYCGPSYGSLVNAPCDVAGATGWCYPQSGAEDGWGLCVESGTLAAGADCDSGYPLDEIPRTTDTCQAGLCGTWVADHRPRCLPFCDPVTAYDATPLGATACPAGFNCLNFSYISSSSLHRLADKGLCVPTPTTDASGLLACDLLEGGLIADRAVGCDDLLPGTSCGYWRNGSLMGTCRELDATPLGLGATCDAGAALPPCAEGLLCANIDPFGTGDATDTACLEICDAAATWTCDATGLACTSLSVAYFTEDATSDDSPSRFGLCAPPPPG